MGNQITIFIFQTLIVSQFEKFYLYLGIFWNFRSSKKSEYSLVKFNLSERNLEKYVYGHVCHIYWDLGSKRKKKFSIGNRVLAKKQVGNFLSDFGSIEEAKVSLKGWHFFIFSGICQVFKKYNALMCIFSHKILFSFFSDFCLHLFQVIGILFDSFSIISCVKTGSRYLITVIVILFCIQV